MANRALVCRGNRRLVMAIVGAVGASVALRLRFLTTPLTVDEAGAVTVARAWNQGQALYVDTFIDRPQGVIVLFQRWQAWFGPSPTAVRALAILAGISVVLATAATVRSVAGRSDSAVVAAWLVAVISSSAAIEGHTANGELLVGALAVPAMAIAAGVVTGRIAAPAMAAAGALAALGLTVKQSGFDVLVAIGLWLVVALWQRWRPVATVVTLAAWLVGGAAVVVGAAAWHGATLGWNPYTYALYGYRLHARSAVASPQAGRFLLTIALLMTMIGPALALGAHHVRSLTPPWRGRIRPEHVLLLGWAGISLLGFLIGGNYHRHYGVQLTFPASAIAAIALTAGPAASARRLVRSTAMVLALPLLLSLALIVAPAWERDDRVDADAAIAQWYRSHRSGEQAGLLPLCASATWYPLVRQLPRTPYLWVDHVRDGRGSIPGLVRLLTSEERPQYLAMHQSPDRCDPTGRLGHAIDGHYRRVATVDDVPILEATDD